MKVAGGKQEDGVVIGNRYDKYGSANPIVRHVMRGFDESLTSLVKIAEPNSIHEVGCGEGYWSCRWAREGIPTRGSDFSHQVIRMAQENANELGLGSDSFSVKSVYDLEPNKDAAELMVCCEVLEHLENPRAALEALQKTTENHIILSVPREPIWRFLNMMRGHYWGSLGNTPGHLQHWSSGAFVRLVSEYFEIEAIRKPLPWTMVLAKAKGNS